MAWIAVIAVTLLAFAIVLAWLARSRPPRPSRELASSAVTRQHLHLLQGGRLCESEIESAKTRLNVLLERGELDQALDCLRPGLTFAVHVQALSELKHPAAATILERKLLHRFSDDPVEQSWYWIDLAHGLRSFERPESMAYLLRCPAIGLQAPLGEFFAAEAACSAGFFESLRQPGDPLGRAALTVLHRTLRGVRGGVPPQVIGEGRLGQAVVRVWKNRPERTDPRVVRVLIEGLRLLRRAEHYNCAFRGHAYHIEALNRQVVEIGRMEDTIADYLSDAPWMLVHELANATDATRTDLLLALDDLRADAAMVVIPNCAAWPAEQRERGIALLRYSTDLETGAWLRERCDQRHRADSDRPIVLAALRALRGHAGGESEATLLAVASDRDNEFRHAAVGSMGWWEPFRRTEVLSRLRQCRDDPHAEVRLAAQSALARLGERRALQWFQQSLVGETHAAVADAVRRIALERLTLLWPDVDGLADTDDWEVSQSARETLEQLREDMAGGLLVT